MGALNVIKNEANIQLTPNEISKVKDWTKESVIDMIFKRLENQAG
jgi:hypothetical protein